MMIKWPGSASGRSNIAWLVLAVIIVFIVSIGAVFLWDSSSDGPKPVEQQIFQQQDEPLEPSIPEVDIEGDIYAELDKDNVDLYFTGESYYAERFAIECELFNQNNVKLCMAMIDGGSEHCDQIEQISYQLNISFKGGSQARENCYELLNNLKSVLGDDLKDFDNMRGTNCEEFPTSESTNEKNKNYCLALKNQDISHCDLMISEFPDEILMCKALISKKIEYCEVLDSLNRCPFTQVS